MDNEQIYGNTKKSILKKAGIISKNKWIVVLTALVNKPNKVKMEQGNKPLKMFLQLSKMKYVF